MSTQTVRIRPRPNAGVKGRDHPVKRITLTTTGRKTGDARTASLYAFDDNDRVVIVGSRGGAARDPNWAINLRAHPDASVKHGKTTHAVRAREANGAEHERLWELVCGEFPLYRTYQRRTKRQIPLFVLEPVDG